MEISIGDPLEAAGMFYLFQGSRSKSKMALADVTTLGVCPFQGMNASSMDGLGLKELGKLYQLLQNDHFGVPYR